MIPQIRMEPLILATIFPNWMPNPPALAIGIIMAIYWWRVLRMAYKMRKQTGRAANFVPTEAVGKILRILWQPIVWLWVAVPLISAFLIHPPAFMRSLFYQPILHWLAVAIALAAFYATKLCWKRMGKSWRMGIDPGEKTTLIVSGPYAYVRHPIYALSSLLMLMSMLAIPSPLMIAVGIIHLLLLQWEARREEQNLIRVHGDVYQKYYDAVGRFIPIRLSSYHA